MKLQFLTLSLVITSLFTGFSQKVEADTLLYSKEHQALESQDWVSSCINNKETIMSFLGEHRLTSVSVYSDEKCQTLKQNTTTFDDIKISAVNQEETTSQIKATVKALKSSSNKSVSITIQDNKLTYSESDTPSLDSEEIKVFLALQD